MSRGNPLRVSAWSSPSPRMARSCCARTAGSTEVRPGQGDHFRAHTIDLPGTAGNIHAIASFCDARPTRIQETPAMIDLYYWTTPNGHKITMFLEETGLAYKIFPINIGKGEQFKPEFLAVAPNNRIPAMVDHEPKGG